MSLLSNRKVILAKIESMYGSDPTPTGTTDAMLVKNLEVQPLNAQLVQRDLIRDYLGNSDTLVASRFATANFEIEMAGAGSAGATPGYDPLLRACGFAKSSTSIVISTLTRTSTTATADCAAVHGLTSGDFVTISGAVETEYNGSFMVTVTDTDSFTYTVTGSPSTPATGTPILNTSKIYSPVSTAFESITMWFYLDGVLHKLTGCRGSFEIALQSKQIPSFKFSFTGLYNPPTDTSIPSTDFTSFQLPKVANTANTPSFSLFGYQGVMDTMSLNLTNTVNYRTLIGSEEVKIVDRKPTGTFVLEATLVATKDYWTLANAGTTGVMTLTHGTVGGNKVKLDSPRVSIGNPSYQDQDGVEMVSIPFTISPVTGNDELTITVK